MKFFCEYCGNRIDAEKDHKCPHCGASYKQNENFIKLEEEKNKNAEINNKYKHEIMNHVLGTMKVSKVFMLIPVIAFILIVTIVIVGFLSIDNRKNNLKVDDLFDSALNNKTQEQEKITVNFNEFAETEKYKVKVEKYAKEEDVFHKAEAGYELVKFHLVVENTSTGEIRSEDVNCIVDGVAQNNTRLAGYSDLPIYISRELAVKGTATFIVPINATSYDIRYGDYVTIHIEK